MSKILLDSISFAVLGAVSACFLGGAAHAVSLGAPERADLGETITATIDADAGDMIGAIDLRLTFDPAALVLDGIFFGGLGASQSVVNNGIDLGLGFIDIFMVWSAPDLAGPGTLLEVDFVAAAIGTSTLQLEGVFANSDSPDPTAFDVSASLNVVPLPAAGWLLIGGVTAIAALGRRRA